MYQLLRALIVEELESSSLFDKPSSAGMAHPFHINYS
jgi:hypothetical protein